MADPSTPIASTPKRRFVMTPRRWATLSVICFLAAAYYLCYEHFPVHITKDTPLFKATRYGKQGIVTTGGRIVVPFEWWLIRDIDSSGSLELVRQDTEGNVTVEVRTIGRLIGTIPATAEPLKRSETDSAVLTTVDSIWTPIINARFDDFGLMAVEAGSVTGWINRDGELAVRAPSGFRPASNFYNCGLALVETEDGLQGCIDRTGALIVPPQWQHVEPLATCPPDKFLLRVTREHRSGDSGSDSPQSCIVTSDGAEVLSEQYQLALVDIDHRLLIAQDQNGVYGAVDYSGKTAIPFEYQFIGPFGTTGYAWAQRNEKFGWIDTSGITVVPFVYDDIHSLMPDLNSAPAINKGELIVFSKFENGFGALDSTGREVVAPVFNSAAPVFDDSSVVSFTNRNHKVGLISCSGDVVMPVEYDFIERGTSSYCIARKASLTSLVSKQFEVLNLPSGDDLNVLSSAVRMHPNGLGTSNQYFQLTRASGSGVYDVQRGEIVPAMHNAVWETRCGFRCLGLQARNSPLEQYSAWFTKQLNNLMPSLITDADDVEIFYDFNGNIIWRSDARFGDLIKAFGLSCWGLYCLRRYRVARREQRMLQAA